MTTTGHGYTPDAVRKDADAVLVRGSRPARSSADGVAVSPRLCAACDGERWHLPVVVRVVAGDLDRRRQFRRTRLVTATSFVADAVREHDLPEVRFFRTRHLDDYWPRRTVDHLEERLVGVARGTDARLVTWTGVEGECARSDLYDQVFG